MMKKPGPAEKGIKKKMTRLTPRVLCSSPSRGNMPNHMRAWSIK
jgi:hypothetical protein